MICIANSRDEPTLLTLDVDDYDDNEDVGDVDEDEDGDSRGAEQVAHDPGS